MAKIKSKKKTVIFNMSERELCSICGYPEHFCKHTIEDEYKEQCPETPLDKEDIWQLVRSHALISTQRKNLLYHINEDINEIHKLKDELNIKIKKLDEYFERLSLNLT